MGEIDLIAAMTNPHLSPFDGKDVVRSAVALFGTDGLSEAMAVDPIEIPQGSTGTMVIRWTCAEVKHKAISKDTPDLLSRNHRLRVEVVAFAEADTITKLLDEQTERIRKAKDAAKGVQELPMVEGDGAFGGSDEGAQEIIDKATKRAKARAEAAKDPGVVQSGEFSGEPFDAEAEKARATRRRPVRKAVAGTMPEEVPDNVTAIRPEGTVEHG